MLLSDANFMCLVYSFSILAGWGWAYATVVGQILAPCGYSPAVAGAVCAAMAAAGGLGCVLYVFMLSRLEGRRPYATMQLWFSVAYALALAAVLFTARPGKPIAAVVAVWALVGLTSGPVMGPLPIEHGAEITFPAPANASTTVLSVVSSVVSFLQASFDRHPALSAAALTLPPRRLAGGGGHPAAAAASLRDLRLAVDPVRRVCAGQLCCWHRVRRLHKAQLCAPDAGGGGAPGGAAAPGGGGAGRGAGRTGGQHQRLCRRLPSRRKGEGCLVAAPGCAFPAAVSPPAVPPQPNCGSLGHTKPESCVAMCISAG